MVNGIPVEAGLIDILAEGMDKSSAETPCSASLPDYPGNWSAPANRQSGQATFFLAAARSSANALRTIAPIESSTLSAFLMLTR